MTAAAGAKSHMSHISCSAADVETACTKWMVSDMLFASTELIVTLLPAPMDHAVLG